MRGFKEKKKDYRITYFLIFSVVAFIAVMIVIFSWHQPTQADKNNYMSSRASTDSGETILHSWVVQNKAHENIAIELLRTPMNYKIIIDIHRPCVDRRNEYFNQSDQVTVTKARIGPDEIIVFIEGCFILPIYNTS